MAENRALNSVVIFGPTTPLHSRDALKSRDFHNFAIVFAIFIPLVGFFSVLWYALSFPVIIGDAIAIGFVYYLFTLWNKRPIGLLCDHCDAYLATNTPWVCGYCGHKNTNANDHPFIGPCAGCGNEPKAYKCHHETCGKTIFFTRDKDESHCAHRLGSGPQPPVDTQAAKALEREEAKRDKENAVAMADLDVKLKEAKAKLAEPKVKTPYEQQQEKFTRFYEGILGADDIAEKALAAARIEFKDNPEALERREEVIKKWKRLNTP